MTGAVSKIDITGRDGKTLNDCWKAGPANFLGLFVSGIPNLFQINGPGSPSVLTNMINGIEQHCEWITSAILKMEKEGIKAIDATKEAQDAWVEKVNSFGDTTIFGGCASWWVFWQYLTGIIKLTPARRYQVRRRQQ